MSQSVLLRASGLYTFPNTLSEVPQGALTTADNTVIDRNGVIESRRGNVQYGTSFGLGTDYASQLMTYKKTLLMQDIQDYDVWYDSDGMGTWLAFNGSYPPAQVGTRTKYMEANGNFYFTSANGIECISASSASQFTTAPNYIRQSGGIQALDVSGTLDYSGGGWFIYPSSIPGQSKVAYRITWGFYDANQDFVEGVPSSQLVLTNYSETASATVNLTFQIPSQILALAPNNTQFFYTIYRTAVVQTSIGVTLATLYTGDEEYQVIQAFPTAAQLAAGVVTVNDPTPESFRAEGALLYTNPISGQGILQSNYPPPFALDINLYQQTTFYANTATKQQYNTALLSTEALISGTSTITVAGQTYTFVGTPEIQDFTFDTQAATVDGGYFNIWSASNNRGYFVWFSKSGQPEIQTVTFDNTVMPSAGSYWLLNSANDTDEYFIWYDPTIDGTTPTPAGADTIGRTGIKVASYGFTTGTQIASATASVIPTVDFDAVPSNNAITITNLTNGVTTQASNGAVPVGGAFTVTVNQLGTNSTQPPVTPDTIGEVGIEVNIQDAVTANDVATDVVEAINQNADFNGDRGNYPPAFITTPGGSTVRITNADNGITQAASNGYTEMIPSPVNIDNVTYTIILPGNMLSNTEITYTSTGSPITGLVSGNIYYIVNSTSNTFQISNTFNGPPIHIASGGDTGEQSFSVSVGGIFTIAVVQYGTGLSGSFYTFDITAANATAGTSYTNNGQTFTVLNTIFASTVLDAPLVPILIARGTGAPDPTGTLMVVPGTGQGDSTITYSSFTHTENEVLLGNDLSPAISIDETARSLIMAVNANILSPVNAFYESGPTSLPGLILFQAKTLVQGPFYLTVDSYNPNPPPLMTGNEFSPPLPVSGTSAASTNQVQINAIFYSKYQQPEAVPLVNYFLVGPKDKAILRILPIRTGLMIFKEDGIYQLTGVNGQFTINPFDSSALILAPDSAVVLNNQVYMFSTQGVVTVTDTGVNIISRPIENSLQTIITPQYNFIPNTFGVAYEADRAYLLWTVTDSNDTLPTQCFRYNTLTNAWTRWPISKNCGVVLINQNVLYLGPTDINMIEQERKNVDRTDYADRQYLLELSENFAITPTEITLSSVAHVIPGSVLVQTQNLTIADYNQMLQKLDLEPNTTKDYFTTLGIQVGADLRNAVNLLALKLDTDPGLHETNFFSSLGLGPTFANIQADFNIIVGLLNTNPYIYHTNFPMSIGTQEFEALIEDTIINTNNVDLVYSLPLVVGPIELYEGIPTDITWAPQTFGDPTISKHVSEGTFLFDNTDFYSATVSYATDLSQNFESVDFLEAGIGDWGYFIWGNQAWGGNGQQTPLRTYIPRYKQYCRFIKPNFTHINAREKYAIFGTSLTFRPITERAYRS